MPKSIAQKVASEKLKTEVMELLNTGKNLTEIAKIVGLTVGRISQIVTERRQEWTAKRDVATQDHIEVEVAYVRAFRQEALAAWDRSKEDAVTMVTTKAPPRQFGKTLRNKHAKASKKLAVIRQEEKRVGQVGDVACLHIAVECTDKLLRLLGAYPKEDKTEINNVLQINWQELSVPIPSITPMALTPADEVEARIEAESKPPSSNGNGQH